MKYFNFTKILLSGILLLSLSACNKEPADTSSAKDLLSQDKETAAFDKDYENEDIPYESPSESYKLVKAACYGNNQLVKELLEKDISIINKESFFLEEETTHTPLSCALTGTYKEGYTPKHREVVKTLLEYGVDVNQPDPSGQDPMYCTPLQLAVRANDLEIAKLLVEKGADVNLTVRAVKLNDNGTRFVSGYCRSSLEIAEKKGNTEMIEWLLSVGADKNQEANEIILQAGQEEYAEIVQLLKQAGAKQRPNSEGNCFSEVPLVQASEKGDVKEVKELLSSGVDVNARLMEDVGIDTWERNFCHTALMKAGSAEVVRALVAAGADIHALDKDGNNALMFNVWYSPNAQVVKALITAGADVNEKNKKGVSALRYATFPDGGYNADTSKEVVKQILIAGADVNAVDNEGITALMSVAYNHIFYDATTKYSDTNDLIYMLLEAGALVNASDKKGKTVLMHAINAYKDHQVSSKQDNVPPKENLEKDVLNIIHILLTAGADVNVKDKDGNTALKLAQEAGNEQIIELLKQAGAKE